MRSLGRLWHILGPKRAAIGRRTGSGSRSTGKLVTLSLVVVGFWAAAFGILYRILSYFQGVEDIGDLLAVKLLGLILLTFLGILLLSNLVTALSTFFLARDLELLLGTPSDWLHLFGAKLGETVVHSSWMVALMCLPILAAYERVYGGGLTFYLVAVLTLLPFFVIVGAMGSMLTLGLVRVFPARRAKDLLGVVTVAAAGGAVLLIRLLRPEGLARPEGFRNLGEFLALLRGPTSPWLPSEWATDALVGTLQRGFDPFPLLLLWTSAMGMVTLGAIVHGRFYPAAFTRSQEGVGRSGSGSSRRPGSSLRYLIRPLGLRRSELLLKDVRLFFRDTTQWSQLILLGVLVVVYIYNIRALPLYTEGVSFFLAHLVSFMNVGLAGFVLSAIAARFVFPAVSLEGRTFWLLRSSPVHARDLVWTKYWTGTAPLLVLAVLLTVGTNLLLEVGPAMMVLSVVTIAAITFALSALALAFGTVYPQFETENTAQISTSFGGMLYMMTAIALVGGVLALESWPVLTLFRSRLSGSGLSGEVLLVTALATTGAVVICACATVFPLRTTLRRLESLEL